MTNEVVSTSNVQMSIEGFTEKDIVRAIHQLTYRKTYNKSEKARDARKLRQERLQAAMRWVREHPEVML